MHRDTIHIEITYNVSADRVWSALTDRSQIKEWSFDMTNFTPEEGIEFEFSKSGFKREFLHRCRILEVKKGELLKYTWTYPGVVGGESVVTWELIPRGNVVSLRLTHSGLLNHEDGGASFTVERFESGWGDVLRQSLANYLEK